MLWAWLPRKSGGALQGRIQDFPNWGVETHHTKSGGWGGGGGAGGGFCTLHEMGEGGCCTLQNVGGGSLAKMREVPSMKGGGGGGGGGLQPPLPLGATGHSVNYAQMAPPNSCAALFVPEADTGFSVRE